MIDISFPVAESKKIVRTLRDDLRRETRQEHDDLEAALDLLGAGFGLANYRNLLVKFHQFHVPFEAYLDDRLQQGCASAKFYCEGRLKIEWLAQDLKALDTNQIVDAHCVLQSDFATLFPSTEHIWGAVYVIEGSTLGGTVLSKHFMKTLGIMPDTGLRFFTGYGQQTSRKWTETLQQLEACEKQNLSQANIIAGAKRMFLLLKQHLAHVPLE